jgi:hypothetical protein
LISLKAPGAIECAAQAVEEQHPVGQAGERVRECLAGEMDLRALALDRVGDRSGEQRRMQLGLEQVVLRAGLHRGEPKTLGGGLGHDDDRRVRGGRCEVTQRRERVLGGRQLEQHAAVSVVGELLHGVGDVRGLGDEQPLRPGGPEHLDDHRRGSGIVSDQQHSLGLAAPLSLLHC